MKMILVSACYIVFVGLICWIAHSVISFIYNIKSKLAEMEESIEILTIENNHQRQQLESLDGKYRNEITQLRKEFVDYQRISHILFRKNDF